MEKAILFGAYFVGIGFYVQKILQEKKQSVEWNLEILREDLTWNEMMALKHPIENRYQDSVRNTEEWIKINENWLKLPIYKRFFKFTPSLSDWYQ